MIIMGKSISHIRVKVDMFQNEELAKDEILAFFSSHVQTLNRIYDTMFTTYDGQIGYGITQFAVERTKVSAIRRLEFTFCYQLKLTLCLQYGISTIISKKDHLLARSTVFFFCTQRLLFTEEA